MSALAGIPIAIDATALLSPRTGVGQHTFHLVRELQGLLAEKPFLFYAGHWDTELRASPAPSAALRRSLNLAIPDAYKLSLFLQQWRFSRGVRRHRIRLYHQPNFVALRFDGPTIVTVHDLSWIRFPEMHPGERVKLMNETMPAVMARAARVIVVSDFVRQEVIAQFGLPPGRVCTVHNGVSGEFRPLGAVATAPTLALHGLRHGEYVLAVGTLEPRKDFATVARAFARLPEASRRRFPLVIAGMTGWGEQPVPDAVRSMSARGEAKLLGYVPQEHMAALYSGARVFVYPSLYEGFGLPPLEAMACGAPVIVSTAASLPEVVGDAGALVEPRDDQAIASLLQSFIDDDAMRGRYSAAGIARAARFGWRQSAQQTLAVYESALRGA